jgi:hypothetical protein
LNGCSGLLWEVSRSALNIMEDLLNAYYIHTLPTITHKLNVPRHMFIRTFFLILVCGTCAKSFSAHSSYTLYGVKWDRKVIMFGR